MRDIYAAIAHRSAFAIGAANDNPACPVESAVNQVLEDALSSAEEALLRRLAQVRLADGARERLDSSGACYGLSKTVEATTRLESVVVA